MRIVQFSTIYILSISILGHSNPISRWVSRILDRFSCRSLDLFLSFSQCDLGVSLGVGLEVPFVYCSSVDCKSRMGDVG